MAYNISGQNISPNLENAQVNVSVTNENGKALSGETVSFVAHKDNKTYKAVTDKNGQFSILIPSGDTYEINYKYFTEEINYNNISIPADEKVYAWDVKIVFEPGKKIILENVEFEFDKHNILPSSHKTLDDLVEAMKIKDKLEIEIGGHTDGKGTHEYNLRLSQNRANEVRKYLISKGIDGKRITAVGYASTQPIATNKHSDGSDNPQGRQANRRTEVKITKEQP